MSSEKWVVYFDHEDAIIYNTKVKLEGGHTDDCGCAQFRIKENAQQYLIWQLQDFVTRTQAVVDDAKVRIVQIEEAIKNNA